MLSFRLSCLLALAALALAPAFPASAGSSPLAQQQVLKRGNGAEPESLDPALVQSVPASDIVADLFEGLTALDVEGAVVPGVARAWRQRDALTWEFDLRESSWSDGRPVTADDFVYAWRRYLDPRTAAQTASSFDYFLFNGREVNSGQVAPDLLGVRALDPLRLEVRTAFPVPYLPEIVAHGNFVPVPRHAIEQYGAHWARPGTLVGNGAFTLDKWVVNGQITLLRNPQYWDAEHVLLQQVQYASVEDHVAELKLYQAGELDITKGLPAGSFTRLQKTNKHELHVTPTLSLRYFSLNNTDPLLADKRVRQALSMVIDRDILAERITANGERAAYSVALQGTTGARQTQPYEWVQWPMADRVKAAAALLSQAGVAPGTPLKIVYNTNDLHKRVALFMASEWQSKLGLRTTLENMEFRVLLRERNAGNFQVARDGWVADYRDIGSMLSIVRCRSKQNSNRNCNEQAERLLEQAQNEPDDAARIDLQTRATTLIMQDYPMIPLAQMADAHLVKPHVGGYGTQNALGRYRSQYLYIKAR